MRLSRSHADCNNDVREILAWESSGFSLDAAERVIAGDRTGLQRLLRYAVRPLDARFCQILLPMPAKRYCLFVLRVIRCLPACGARDRSRWTGCLGRAVPITAAGGRRRDNPFYEAPKCQPQGIDFVRYVNGSSVLSRLLSTGVVSSHLTRRRWSKGWITPTRCFLLTVRFAQHPASGVVQGGHEPCLDHLLSVPARSRTPHLACALWRRRHQRGTGPI